MIRSFHYLLLFLFIATSTLGQDSLPKIPVIYSKARFSLMAGISLLSVRENDQYDENGDLKLGFSAGFGIMKSLTSNLQLQGKIQLERKGHKTSGEGLYSTPQGVMKSNWSNNYSLDYLTISLAPQFLMGEKKAISLGFGAYYGLMIRAKYHYVFSPNTNKTSFNKDSYSTKDDYGLTLSLGYSFSLNKKFMLDLQVTENYGLMSIYNQFLQKQKNNSISVTVAFRKK